MSWQRLTFRSPCYGGRAEIVDAVKELCSKVLDGEISIEEVGEEELTRAMYVPELPEPDLVISMSGEKRLSGSSCSTPRVRNCISPKSPGRSSREWI